jgi:hypothetical protein
MISLAAQTDAGLSRPAHLCTPVYVASDWADDYQFSSDLVPRGTMQDGNAGVTVQS